MIVVEGTPGAGKTTLLGKLLETAPQRTVVFPEAQPPDKDDNEAVTHALIAEDLARTTTARSLHRHMSNAVIASDRCHLGVLAYRRALWRTGRAPRDDFDFALRLCQVHRVCEAHCGDTVLVLLLDPDASIRRRARFAGDSRYALWYERDFLVAYNDVLIELVDIFSAHAETRLYDVTDWTPDRIRSIGLDVAGLGEERAQVVTTVGDLTCGKGCPEPRSAVLASPGLGLIQLYASAVHRRHTGRTACLRTAADIEASCLLAGRRRVASTRRQSTGNGEAVIPETEPSPTSDHHDVLPAPTCGTKENTAMTRTTDITWRDHHGVFKYRVAALVTRDDQLLLCRVDGLDYSFLPGGKAQLGESTRDALARELLEELGRTIPIGDLALVIENLYDDGQLQHELGFYYRVPWPQESGDHTADAVEARHHFTWASFDQLETMNFRPAELVPLLQEVNSPLRHVVLDRRPATNPGQPETT